MFFNYLHYVALMDEFAANGGEDGKAAASARDDEQKACGLGDSDDETLRRVAGDCQKDTQNDLIDPRGDGISPDGTRRERFSNSLRPKRANRFQSCGLASGQ